VGQTSLAPPLAGFLHARMFKDEAFSVKYYAHIHEIREVQRRQLFPDEAQTTRKPMAGTIS
jgi:hypothetical protein